PAADPAPLGAPAASDFVCFAAGLRLAAAFDSVFGAALVAMVNAPVGEWYCGAAEKTNAARPRQDGASRARPVADSGDYPSLRLAVWQQYGRAGNRACTKPRKRIVGCGQRIGLDVYRQRDGGREREKADSVRARQIGNRADAALTP